MTDGPPKRPWLKLCGDMPESPRGETVVAYVSLRHGRTVSTDELIAFCRERSATYKVPCEIVVLAELPKKLSGEILRRELRERAVPSGT
jgi:long-chain acyl-CoA synthetase